LKRGQHPSRGGRSLGGRLSGHLALQTFVGLAAVSLLVFLALRAHLIAREERSLDEMQALVVHLVDEAANAPRTEGIEHALRDQFAGREEARLELFDPTGRPLLASGSDRVGENATAPSLMAGRVRVRDFTVPGSDPASNSDGALRARLHLVTARDDALLARLVSILVAAVLSGTLVTSLAAFWRVRRELAPLGRLVAQIDELGELDAEHLGLSRRLDGIDQPRELQPLIGRFNELLQRLDGSYRQMAAFNADVAHELNTPLATLIASNEIAARRRGGLTASEEELIGSNLEELQRLRGIVRDMLFLSTAGRGGQARRSHVPSLAGEALGVLDYHEAALEQADLRSSVEGEASAEIDVALVRRALSNLVGNATRHATPGTRIELSIEPLVAGTVDRVRLSVSNHGEGVSAEQLERLFERAYRLDEVTTPAVPAADRAQGPERCAVGSLRHGLGLSIVSAIARMHGGRPFATSVDGVTTIGFTLAVRPASPANSPRH